MKHTLQLFCLVILLLNIDYANATVYPISNYNMLKSDIKVKRTYLYSKANSYSETKRNINFSKKDTDVQITLSDFQNHLAAGKKRISMGLNSPQKMNIGAINSGVQETWVLPDFTKDSNYKSIIIDQIPVTGTALYDSFLYGTNAFYSKDANTYELYDLHEFELYLIGYNSLEDGVWKQYTMDQTKVPIPVKANLEHTSVVRYDGEVNPEDNYLEYTDVYYVVGQGTLQTFDDGDADALKLIYKREKRVMENGVLISFTTRFELVFYSKKGHYVVSEIDDPWSSTGEVTLKNMNYQRLESKTASVNESLFANTKTFPNPIAAGQLLTVESKISLINHSVIVYNVNGQQISNLTFSEGNNNQYQIKIPEQISSGLFFYKIHDKKGTILTNGKIKIE